MNNYYVYLGEYEIEGPMNMQEAVFFRNRAARCGRNKATILKEVVNEKGWPVEYNEDITKYIRKARQEGLAL